MAASGICCVSSWMHRVTVNDNATRERGGGLDDWLADWLAGCIRGPEKEDALNGVDHAGLAFVSNELFCFETLTRTHSQTPSHTLARSSVRFFANSPDFTFLFYHASSCLVVPFA